jgi:hypothetical protein
LVAGFVVGSVDCPLNCDGNSQFAKYLHGGHIMKKIALTSVALAAVLSLGATAGFAQEGLHNAKKQDQAPAKTESDAGVKSSIPAGQGGTTGQHPTGANVGPGRAEMNHAN